MKNILFTILIILAGKNIFGQQVPYVNHYLENPYLINPANAGANGGNLFLDYRKQWAGIVGAPESQFLTLDAPLKNKNMAVGVKVFNDANNIIVNTGAMLTYAYKVKFSEKQHLDFGVSLGMAQNKILFDRITAEYKQEALLFAANQNASNVDADFGINYQLGNFNLGATAYHLFANSYQYENSFDRDSLTFSVIPHYFGIASYKFDFKEKPWSVLPGVLVRNAQGSPLQIDGFTQVTYKNTVWAKLNYRHQIGYALTLGGVIEKKYTLAYSYEMSSREIGNHTSGTHEFLLGVKIGKGNSAGGLTDKELKRLENQNLEILEKSDYLERENAELRDELNQQKELVKQYIDGLEELKNSVEKDQKELEELISNKEVILSSSQSISNANGQNSTNSNGEGSQNNTLSSQSSENSSDVNENKQYSVIVGAAKALENVKKFQKIIKKEYDLDSQIIQNESKTWYFVTTMQTDSKEKAYKELNRVRKLNTKDVFIGKPWVYKP